MKKAVLQSVIFFVLSNGIFSQPVQTPEQVYGELFRDVQLQHIFTDSKFFVDCVPTKSPETIVREYLFVKKNTTVKFSLLKFIEKKFQLPLTTPENYISDTKEDVATHINELWNVLKRSPDKVPAGSSLLPLPYPYIVPGGRFREMYYWDSYFIMLGLQASGQYDMIEDMVNNFTYLISTYGYIPNGNRTYYLSRSQPPFLSLMIDLLAEKKGAYVYATYLNALQDEHNYWMDKGAAAKHVITMPDGSELNRYYDQADKPREEAYAEDYKLINGLDKDASAKLGRNIRSAAESGWDFSSRWLADEKNLSTLQTTDIVPVDLNCSLYHLELTLAKCYRETGNLLQASLYTKIAAERKAAINKYCWNENEKWYVDYNIAVKKQSREITLAGLAPLFFEIASNEKATATAETIRSKFLKEGGLVTTLKNTGQQWDAPNGWAPMQWMAVKGLKNYDQSALAKEIAERWIALNRKVYKETGKLMDRYNVMNTHLPAGGSEYAGHDDGFGWTNGVLLKLIQLYGGK